jgi:hypothetical protein
VSTLKILPKQPQTRQLGIRSFSIENVNFSFFYIIYHNPPQRKDLTFSSSTLNAAEGTEEEARKTGEEK